jgi:hypothetical protein
LTGTYQFKTPESSPPGTPIGRIKASDADVGENAEIEYSITDGEGHEMFDVITDQETQEGIITVKKVMPLIWILDTTPGAEEIALWVTGLYKHEELRESRSPAPTGGPCMVALVVTPVLEERWEKRQSLETRWLGGRAEIRFTVSEDMMVTSGLHTQIENADECTCKHTSTFTHARMHTQACT